MATANEPAGRRPDFRSIGEDDDDAIAERLLREEDDDDPTAAVPSVRNRTEYAETSTKFATERTSSPDDLPAGIPDGFRIIQHAAFPRPGFDQSYIEGAFPPEEIERLKLRPDDVTVPVALRLLFPDQFASQTRARKEVRRRRVLVHRGPIGGAEGVEGDAAPGRRGMGNETPKGSEVFRRERLSVARVGDRVQPGDTVAIQTRMEHNYSECKNHHQEPPFHLPVMYQDDHFAIVNKPEGIVVFGHKNGGFGRHTVKSCLPWVLNPPGAGVISVMRRPCPVHRIDRGTSGLLVCAKTKPAMVELARLFKERKVKKTYTAVVSGNIKEPKESSISSSDAIGHGVCTENNKGQKGDVRSWQIIDEELEGQSAITIWRVLRRWPLENARNGTVCLVELKPKTGRYHQLRRHMAWVGKCPLLGDKQYDGGGLARTLRDRGFYLCSNKVSLAHPFFNTSPGRKEWKKIKATMLGEKEGTNVRITEEQDGIVMVHCEIDLPSKFNEL